MMSVDELLDTVQYVTDQDGNRQAVIVDWYAWEELVSQLKQTSTGSESVENVAREAAMAREEAAYQAIHPELVQSYLGQHVAIYEGQLVDHDQDGTALYLRVRKRYPGNFVLITPVEKQAEESYVVYSPRLIPSES